MNGDWPLKTKLPLVGGHEGAGVVVARGILLEDVQIGDHVSIKESEACPGQTVAIVGAGGGLGSLACQYAKAIGLKIVAIDAGDEKRVMRAKLGAESFMDFSKSPNIVADVKAATEDGLGPHAVLLLAVSEKPFEQAADYIRPRGSVVMLGMPAGAYLRAPVFESVIKMVTIKGSYVGNRRDTAEALRILSSRSY